MAAARAWSASNQYQLVYEAVVDGERYVGTQALILRADLWDQDDLAAVTPIQTQKWEIAQALDHRAAQYPQSIDFGISPYLRWLLHDQHDLAFVPRLRTSADQRDRWLLFNGSATRDAGRATRVGVAACMRSPEAVGPSTDLARCQVIAEAIAPSVCTTDEFGDEYTDWWSVWAAARMADLALGGEAS